MPADPVGDDGMARLVDGHGMALALDVLDVSGRPEVLQLLGIDDVRPRDPLPSGPDGHDQRFVDEVLDRGAGRTGRDYGRLVAMTVVIR